MRTKENKIKKEFKHKVKIGEIIFTEGDLVYWEGDLGESENGKMIQIVYKLIFKDLTWKIESEIEEILSDLIYQGMKKWH